MSSIELSIGLVCLSLATYKPLMHRIFGKGSRYHYYSNGSRTGATTASSHGAVEEIQTDVAMEERISRGLESQDASHLGSLGTAEKSWISGSPHTDTGSDTSDHWRGGTAT